MKPASIKTTLFKLHRWIGIVLAPLFLAIIVSGGVLALKPMQTPPAIASTSAISGQQLIELLDSIDPQGSQIEAARIDAATGHIDIQSPNPYIAGHYDPSNGKRVASTAQSQAFDLFEMAEYLHKELLVGAGVLVQAASYLMLITLVVAPLLASPDLRHNLRGWHLGFGWVLLPVIVMLPLTGVLMSLHIGMPELPPMSQPGTRLNLQQALMKAQQHESLSDLQQLRRLRGGSLLLSLRAGESKRLLVVTDQSVTPINPDANLVKTLHEGTWAGPWSGSINLLGATTLGLLTLTGSLSWLRRRRLGLQLQAKRALSQEAV
jgi:sulfite reductase (NADPH) flavoprotein alpha-component